MSCKKPCRSDQICNEATKKCVLKNGKVGLAITAGTYSHTPSKRVNHKPSSIAQFGVPCKKKCTGGTVCNPSSGRCVSRNGRNGKKLVRHKNFKLDANSRFDWESNLYGHIFPQNAMQVHGIYKGKCKFGARLPGGKCPKNPNPAPKKKYARKAPKTSAKNSIGQTSVGLNGSMWISTPAARKGEKIYRWARVQ